MLKRLCRFGLLKILKQRSKLNEAASKIVKNFAPSMNILREWREVFLGQIFIMKLWIFNQDEICVGREEIRKLNLFWFHQITLILFLNINI